jgi:hypothetical protein
MDDLISRKAAIEYLMTNMGWTDEDGYAVDDADEKRAHIEDLINGIPTVPAVPLDKLCEWLTENRVSIPCRLCEYDDAGKCTVQNDMSKPCPNTTRDWRRVITNWMEGLDDHR